MVVVSDLLRLLSGAAEDRKQVGEWKSIFPSFRYP